MNPCWYCSQTWKAHFRIHQNTSISFEATGYLMSAKWCFRSRNGHPRQTTWLKSQSLLILYGSYCWKFDSVAIESIYSWNLSLFHIVIVSAQVRDGTQEDGHLDSCIAFTSMTDAKSHEWNQEIVSWQFFWFWLTGISCKDHLLIVEYELQLTCHISSYDDTCKPTDLPYKPSHSWAFPLHLSNHEFL